MKKIIYTKLERAMAVTAIALVLVGIIHAFVLIPVWYKEEKGWKIVKNTELVFTKGLTGIDTIMFGRNGWHIFYRDPYKYARVATPEGITLYSQFNRYNSWQSRLKECLVKEDPAHEFYYKVHDWRSAPFMDSTTGVILFAKIFCEPTAPDEMKSRLMYLDVARAAVIYFVPAFMLWLASHIFGLWLTSAGYRDKPLERSPWGKTPRGA